VTDFAWSGPPVGWSWTSFGSYRGRERTQLVSVGISLILSG
jgi:hypothetical protein